MPLTPEQLKALRPTPKHLDASLKQHLVSLGIFTPWARNEHKRQLKRERNRRRRQSNRTHLPIVTTANLRSINNKQCELLQYLEDSRSDIACLTETWIDELNNTPICPEILEKFHVFSNPRRGKQGGGTMIVVRKDYTRDIAEIKSSNNQQDGRCNLETTTIRFRPQRLPRGYSSCLVSSVYIPPSNNQSAEINSLCDHLTDSIDSNSGKPLLLICGDFNKAKASTIKTQLGLYQVNSEPTRKKAVLDLILSNAPKCYTIKNREPIGASDHQTVTATPNRQLYKAITKVKNVRKRVRRGKMAVLIEEFDSIDWDAAIRAPLTPQEKVDVFYETVLEIMDTHQPLRPTLIRNDRPWMTEEIKELITERQRLFHKNNIEWKKSADKVRELIAKQKQIYYGQLDHRNPKELWQRVNEHRSNKSQEIIKFTPDDLSRGFQSVWKGIESQDLTQFTTPPLDAPADLISPSMVMYQLEHLNTTKAPGPDGVSAKILKNARFSLCFLITHLLNLSIRHSFVPHQWKRANITPIAKVDHPQSVGDYRPIALTSTLCKILERIVVREIINATTKVWKSNKQYGFLPGKNTMDAIIKVIDDW